MTESEAIARFKSCQENVGRCEKCRFYSCCGIYDMEDAAIEALEEVQQYRKIGTVEECLKNKDFLDFLSDKMNPNDFEIYLRLYNALEEKGCEE